MFCSKCGAELKEGTKFCTSCGAKLVNEKEVEKVVEIKPEVIKKEEVKPEKSVELKDDKKNERFGGLWFLLLLIMSILIFVIYSMFKQNYIDNLDLMILILPSIINAIFIVIIMNKLNK